MKFHLYALLTLAIVFSTASCKKEDMPYGKDYHSAVKAFQKFQTSSNNSYRYSETNSSSSWVGYNSETIITVRAGKPVQRSFKTFVRDRATGVLNLAQEWVEDEASLNTHATGFRAQTLDQVYGAGKKRVVEEGAASDQLFRGGA